MAVTTSRAIVVPHFASVPSRLKWVSCGNECRKCRIQRRRSSWDINRRVRSRIDPSSTISITLTHHIGSRDRCGPSKFVASVWSCRGSRTFRALRRISGVSGVDSATVVECKSVCATTINISTDIRDINRVDHVISDISSNLRDVNRADCVMADIRRFVGISSIGVTLPPFFELLNVSRARRECKVKLRETTPLSMISSQRRIFSSTELFCQTLFRACNDRDRFETIVLSAWKLYRVCEIRECRVNWL